MISRFILLISICGGILPAVLANTPTIFKSVTIYVVQPGREGPTTFSREETFTHWDKKIELGLGPTYRFSRLFDMLQSVSDGPEIIETLVEAAPIVVVAKREDGKQVELDLSLKSGVMVLRGGQLRDGELYREIVRFVFQMAGEKLPEHLNE